MKKSWSGTIKLGFVTQDVAVYSAADNKAKTVSFNQLHAKCGGRINQDKVCRSCNETLQAADIRKGYEYEKGSYVILDDAEVKACEVETTKVIDLKEFVPASEITPFLIRESHFVAPANAVVSEAFALIRDSLNDRSGIATLALRGKEELVALVPYGRGLALHTLRHASEVRDIADVNVLNKVPESSDPNALAIAQQLIGALATDKLDLNKYPNTYVENVQVLIAEKVAALQTSATPVEPSKPAKKAKAAPKAPSLADLLKASIPAA